MYSVFHDFDQTLARVQSFRWEMDERTERAVTELLIRVEGFAMPMIPIATSNLANSAQRDTYSTGHGWEGQLRFGAEYAAFVHEAPGTLMGADEPRWPRRLGFVWDPQGEPQFLQKAIDRVYRTGLSDWLGRHYA